MYVIVVVLTHRCTLFDFLVKDRGSDRGTSVVCCGSFHGLPWKSAGVHGKGHDFPLYMALPRHVPRLWPWHVPRFCPWQPPWYQPWQPTEVPRQLPRHIPWPPTCRRRCRGSFRCTAACRGMPWVLAAGCRGDCRGDCRGPCRGDCRGNCHG